MAGRTVLFGATGYTGDLTARSLVERGAKPVLAGRSPEKLKRLAGELGGDLETAVADVAQPDAPAQRRERVASPLTVTEERGCGRLLSIALNGKKDSVYRSTL